ncbi:MAG: FGGY family carbohydrate kinase [Actinobacteria bacterium]|nr:FGGY family carbohydrate kinase [Actinomycetota bacterium]
MKENRPILIGVDAGSSVLKVAAFRTDGKLIQLSKREVKIDFSKTPIIEFNIEDYWDAFIDCMEELIAKNPYFKNNIASITVTSQGSTFVMLDSQLEIIRKAIFWMDSRAQEEVILLKNSFSKLDIYKHSGQVHINSNYVLGKLMWIAKNEKQNLSKTSKILFLQDYLIYKLTGEFITDYSIACISSLLDINKKEWWQDILDFIGINRNMLPELCEPGSIVGKMKKDLSAFLNLKCSPIICTGGLDQATSAIGAGNIKPGIVSENTGTVIAVSTVLDSPIWDPNFNIPIFCHSIPGKYYILTWSPNGGNVLKWFRDSILKKWFQFKMEKLNIKLSVEDLDFDNMDYISKMAPPGAEGLLMLPHIGGSGFPEFNPNACGIFFGIKLNHSLQHFLKAIMESIGYILRRNIECMEKLDIDINEIRSLGGGSKSLEWLTIKSDITQKPILILKTRDEAAALGCCLLSSVAIKYYPSYEEAVKNMLVNENIINPNSNYKDLYDQIYNKYLKIYENVSIFF